MQIRTLLAVAASLLMATAAFADAPQPITLDPITHNAGALVIVKPDGTERRLTPADIENLTTYRITTTTPWRQEPADFDGVLLSDLLQSAGLGDIGKIRVIAENDFATTIPREVWETVPVMVATRVNGKAHTRRERGPIQFVMAMDDYANSPLVSEAHLVWMAARIQPE